MNCESWELNPGALNHLQPLVYFVIKILSCSDQAFSVQLLYKKDCRLVSKIFMLHIFMYINNEISLPVPLCVITHWYPFVERPPSLESLLTKNVFTSQHPRGTFTVTSDCRSQTHGGGKTGSLWVFCWFICF